MTRARWFAGIACASLAGCATGLDLAPGGSSSSGGAAGSANDASVSDSGLVLGCPDGKKTTLDGVVRDPAGINPLYNVLVYVPKETPLPLNEGVSCDRCGVLATGKPVAVALTDSVGHFELEDLPAGKDVPLVIQVGKWRRQVSIPEVKSCQPNTVTDTDLLRLPRNKLEGDLPRIAIATGGADPFECLLEKIGIDPAEFTRKGDPGRVHVYVASGGANVDPPGSTADQLWNDLATLKQYDIVILPCEGKTAPDEKSPAARQALVDYTSVGGRVFTTHFGYEWLAHGAAPFPSSGAWHPDQTDLSTDPLPAKIETTLPKGQAFAEWLLNVGATATLGSIDLAEPRHDLDAPANGATAWITATGTTGPSVQELSFNTPLGAPEKDQCGRVLYSDFHVSANASIPGKPFPQSCMQGATTGQEKALEFMLFDLSSCIDKDDNPPIPPPR